MGPRFSADPRADSLHASAMVLDCLYPIHPRRELISPIGRGGVNAIHVTVGTTHHESFRAAVERVNLWLEFLDQYPQLIQLARTATDIEHAHLEGRVAVVLGFQNSSPVEDNPHLLRVLKELGVRVLQLTYNERNLFGDGCTERQNSGLSDLGITFVSEMNRLAMLIDLSHAGERTALEAVEASSDPVIISHACALGLHQNARNVSDALITAVAEKGGVIGISMFPGFVSEKDGKDQTIDDYLDHIDYVVQLAGAASVGIGTDLPDGKSEADFQTPGGALGKGGYAWKADAYPAWPWTYALPSIEGFPRITEGLISRGYTDDEVRGILGLNFLRVFGQVW